MARITEKEAGGSNMLAFLDMLAWAEGTSTSRHTRDDGYDVIVGGIDSPNTFDNYAGHPNKLVTVNKKGLRSTAAGRYQLLFRWWGPYRNMLGLKDFSPVNQDRIAIQQVMERGARVYIKTGDIEEAIKRCSNIWASLPGAGYGQREHRLQDLVEQFKKYGGAVK